MRFVGVKYVKNASAATLPDGLAGFKGPTSKERVRQDKGDEETGREGV